MLHIKFYVKLIRAKLGRSIQLLTFLIPRFNCPHCYKKISEGMPITKTKNNIALITFRCHLE